MHRCINPICEEHHIQVAYQLDLPTLLSHVKKKKNIYTYMFFIVMLRIPTAGTGTFRSSILILKNCVFVMNRNSCNSI